MSAASWADRLDTAIAAKGSPVCLGIDPQLELFPEPLAHLASSTDRGVAAAAVQRFCDEILDALHDLVAVIKPQVAFFERLGPPGWTALERLVAGARARGLLVLADAKRGDLASTAAAYADYFLGPGAGEDGDEDVGAGGPTRATADARAGGGRLVGLGADAMTVNPYLGADSLEPFLRHVARGRGLYLLAKTSNPGSGDLQDLHVAGDDGGRPVYAHAAAIATRVGSSSVGAAGFSSVGIVVGATYPDQARALRQHHPSLPFLVPGYGAQGAGADDVAAGFDRNGRGAIVNASRSLLYAYRSPRHQDLGPKRWAEASRRECLAMRDAIVGAIGRRAAGASGTGR